MMFSQKTKRILKKTVGISTALTAFVGYKAVKPVMFDDYSTVKANSDPLMLLIDVLPESFRQPIDIYMRTLRVAYAAYSIVETYKKVADQEDWTDAHDAVADIMVRLIKAQGGVYVKIGQIIAQMEYLLPEVFSLKLRPFMAAAPVDSFADVLRVLREDGLTEQFEEIERVPIASASIGQVHRAFLKADEGVGKIPVAVKIIHHSVSRSAHADVAALRYIAEQVKNNPKFDFMWLVREIEYAMETELDFTRERQNMEDCAKFYGKGSDFSMSRVGKSVIVPAVYHNACSSRVLTMSFEQGCHAHKSDEIRAMGLDPAEVAHKINLIYNEQIFSQFGKVNVDPHAGNFLVRRGANGESEIVLLDHGLYRDISPKLRQEYSELYLAIVDGDLDGIVKATARWGNFDPKLLASMFLRRSWDKVSSGSFSDLDNREHVMKFSRENHDKIQGILRRIPRELLLILKANDCIRSIDLNLGGQALDAFKITANFALRAKQEHDHTGCCRSMWQRAILNLKFTAASMILDLVGFGRKSQKDSPRSGLGEYV